MHVESKRRQQIHHDVVVVAGVEREVVAACLSHGANDVESLVTVERGDFDGNRIVNLREASPERTGQQPAAGGGLKVETDQRDGLRDRAAVAQQLIFARVLQRAQTEQAGVITEFAGERGFGEGLPGLPADPCDSNGRSSRRADALGFRISACGLVRLGCLRPAATEFLEPQFEDWSEQTDLRIANRELRRVHADGQATGAGGEVIPEQRPLPPLVELALRIQRQRTSRNNEPALQSPVNLRVNTRRHVK